MIGAIFVKVMWVGRATVFLVGLAVILSLTIGLASAGLAAVPGDPLKLGRINTVDAVTQLIGTRNNALLRIDNDSKGLDATALDLQVDPKKPPLKTNSLTKVENLHADLLDGRSADQFANGIAGTAVNADNLDGKDSTSFFSGKTYMVTEERQGIGFGTSFSKTAFCDGGDKVLSGGSVVLPEDDLVLDAPASVSGTSENWTIVVKDNGEASKIVVDAICADFPPLRP